MAILFVKQSLLSPEQSKGYTLLMRAAICRLFLLLTGMIGMKRTAAERFTFCGGLFPISTFLSLGTMSTQIHKAIYSILNNTDPVQLNLDQCAQDLRNHAN